MAASWRSVSDRRRFTSDPDHCRSYVTPVENAQARRGSFNGALANARAANG
jgi:hypothetical protein